MLSYLRTRAFSSGFLGGSRVWIGIGAVVWTIRLFQWLARPETGVIYRERLEPGQSVVIRHSDPPPTRKQRKKAKQQAAKQARAERRAAKKAGRRGAGSVAEPAGAVAA